MNPSYFYAALYNAYAAQRRAGRVMVRDGRAEFEFFHNPAFYEWNWGPQHESRIGLQMGDTAVVALYSDQTSDPARFDHDGLPDSVLVALRCIMPEVFSG